MPESKVEKVKQFPLRVVLSVTTGRLLTEGKEPNDNGIGNLYRILNWVTGDDLFTHQLPRAAESCRPWLFKCFPELASASACLDKLDGWLKSDNTSGAEGVKIWLVELKMLFPEIKDSYDVPQMPDGWTAIDPMIELESMVGKDRVIKVTHVTQP